jgi:hypothetical protein
MRDFRAREGAMYGFADYLARFFTVDGTPRPSPTARDSVFGPE